MEITRKPFQGVLNILDFNRHFYYYGISTLLVILLVFYFLSVPTIFSGLIAIGFAYGLFIPLIVSAYVYDFAGYYSLDWLDNYLQKGESYTYNLVNINAGFDETSFLLKNKLSNSTLHVFDFYDQERHTEPAIIRARKVSMSYPNTKQIQTDTIPIENNTTDIVFLLSSAHEIRDYQEKIQFLKECKRISKENGKVIMVEHLRDIPNFLAFSIGFTHFFSKKVWKRAARKAGFKNITEEKFTPFMSIFEFSY